MKRERSKRTHVEEQIGISRCPGTIRKRRDENAKISRVGTKTDDQQAFQCGGGQIEDVDHGISAVARRKAYLPYRPDAVHRRTAAGEKVGPTGLDIAPLTPFVITVDEWHLGGAP
jgi:hypothetical protein